MAVSFPIAKTTGQCTVRQETAFHAITELGDLGRDVASSSAAPAAAPECMAPGSRATSRGLLAWLDRVFRFLLCVLALAASPALGAAAGDPQAVPTPVPASDRLTSQETVSPVGADKPDQIQPLWDAIAMLTKEVTTEREAISALVAQTQTQNERSVSANEEFRKELAQHADRWFAMDARLALQETTFAALSQRIAAHEAKTRDAQNAEAVRFSAAIDRLQQAQGRLETQTAELADWTGAQQERMNQLRQLVFVNTQSADASAATMDVVSQELTRATVALLLVVVLAQVRQLASQIALGVGVDGDSS